MIEGVEEMTDGNLNNTARAYNLIMGILDDYMEMGDSQKKIVTMWTIGTCFKDDFETFPILYLNAPKSSGKSRLLKILGALIPNSLLTAQMTEANLFRLPKQKNLAALIIDEADGISDKERGNMRELLNSCYKRGVSIARQKKNKETNEYEEEVFEPFVPVAIANIYGLDGVLESRAITIFLDRSNDKEITRKVEVFNLDERFDKCRSTLIQLSAKDEPINQRTDTTTIDEHTPFSLGKCRLCRCRLLYRHMIYLLNKLPTLPTLPTTTTTNTTYTLKDIEKEGQNLYDKLINTTLIGRDFELWLPFYVVSTLVSSDMPDEIIRISEEQLKSKMETNVFEDRDTTFLLFLDGYIKHMQPREMIRIADINRDFRMAEDIPPYEKYPTPEWCARSIKRFNIILEKHRSNRGQEVILDRKKIADKVLKLEVTKGEVIKPDELTKPVDIGDTY